LVQNRLHPPAVDLQPKARPSALQLTKTEDEYRMQRSAPVQSLSDEHLLRASAPLTVMAAANATSAKKRVRPANFRFDIFMFPPPRFEQSSYAVIRARKASFSVIAR
jgi:hypothetical protein